MCTYNILDYGAVADGVTLNTTNINQAIHAAADAGGGTVIVPPGRFLTGTVYLKSHVTLHLSGGAVLVGSTDIADYPENQPPWPTNRLEYGRYSLIFADGQQNIALTGTGTIYGQGDHPNFTKKALEARGWSPRDAYLKRPYGLCFVRCQGVRVRDVTFENIAFWVQDYLECDDVVVDGVTVESVKFDYNNDGIDLDGSRNVRVSNCYFHCGDDAICLKASYRDCENVVITNCVASSLANGIKFGTATNAGFKNIVVSNCAIFDNGSSALALEIVDGGTLDGVTISNLIMREVATPIFIRLGNLARRWVETLPDPMPVGVLRNVTIDGITATMKQNRYDDTRPFCCSITGLPGHPVENIVIRNVRIENMMPHGPETAQLTYQDVPECERDYPEYNMFGPLPAYGFFCRHAHDLTFRNIDVRYATTDYRSAFVCDDVTELAMTDITIQALPDAAPPIVLHASPDPVMNNLRVRGSTPVVVKTVDDEMGC